MMRLLMALLAGWMVTARAFAGLFSPDVAPVDLRCEYLTNPLGIDQLKPRLSWKTEVRGQGSGLSRGVMQTAYRILVASEERLLKEGKADLWDSGKVESDQSIHVEYQGKALDSRMQCFWKVRLWTAEENPETSNLKPEAVMRKAARETESSWSAPALWTMGLLKPEDWKGKWIGAPTEEKVEPAPMFRKVFALDRKVKRATAYICGLGYYELRLNGAKVGDHELDPKVTRYDRRALYVTYDVTAQVRQGANAIGILLGNGWYNYHIRNPWQFHVAPWRAKPKALLQFEVEYADGSTQMIASDESWKYSTGPIRFDGFLSGEVYDARLEKIGWDAPGYDDAGWAAARAADAPKGQLAAQMVEPIRVTEVIKPVKVTQPKPGVYLYDFGQNLAGVARLTVSGPAGAEVKLQYGELLHRDGSLNQNNISPYCQSGEFQTDRYVLKGGGRETWSPRFMYHGFQYVQVTGFPGEPKPENLEALAMHTDMRSAGSFECSSELLNKIQHATRWVYLNNFFGYPMDCPNRERNGWTGDAHLAAETGLVNFDASAGYAQWLLDIKDEQRPSGAIPGIVPTGGWGYETWGGPAWSSAYVLIPWALYLYRGDVRILEDHFDGMKRYVDMLAATSPGLINATGAGDWAPAKTHTPVEITSTAYFYIDTVTLAKVADLLGRKEDGAKYAALAVKIKTAFNRKFLNRHTMQYGRGTQTALSCALYQGLVEPADTGAVLSNLVANVAAHDGHLDCGILGAKYLLRVLTDLGRADVAYQIASQTTWPSWGNWIRLGATTLWESWGGEGTHNHIMYGDISAWFFTALAGIQPDPAAPGFKKIIIKPAVVDGLTWVKCSHDSPYGRIASNWRRENGKLTLDVIIPPNTTATVYVPAKDAAAVSESGKLPAQARGVTFLRTEKGTAVFEVGSGHYTFAAPWPR